MFDLTNLVRYLEQRFSAIAPGPADPRSIPLTSKVQRLYPSEAYVAVRGKKHKAMADQLTTVSKMRLENPVGRLSKTAMRGVEQAITVQLGLIL
jgi:mRNA-degrading endonuclease toxin of MazEF toxin-antitoxin module